MKGSGSQLSLAVGAVRSTDLTPARELAARLGLPLADQGVDPRLCQRVDALLLLSGSELTLQRTGKSAPGPVSVDFGSARMRHRRQSGHNELLGRAVGVGRKSELAVLDATAGLGRDSFVLADLGCRVTMCERDPVVAELLRAGLDVARGSGDPWLAEVVARLYLVSGDARELPSEVASEADVIYLDPMFPQRGKSAAVKKEMALFQQLLDTGGAPDDSSSLLHWALTQDVIRVVVKRPPSAPDLGGVKPTHRLSGKAVRYDIHTLSPWH